MNIVPQNDPPVISINKTDLELFYDEASVWEVGVVSTPENVALKLGDYFQISDPDFNSSNIIGDFYELVEVPEIDGENYPTLPKTIHTFLTDSTPSSTPRYPDLVTAYSEGAVSASQ